MIWGTYEVFDPGVDGPPGELPRREARAAYQRLLDELPNRIEMLRTLASVNGVELDHPNGLRQLGEWFVGSVEPNEDGSGRLANRWYSVVLDIGLYLGEQLIAASNGKLRWEFFTTGGRKSVAYQRHVVMGFDVLNPRYHVAFDLRIAGFAHRVISGTDAQIDYFETTLAKAQALL